MTPNAAERDPAAEGKPEPDLAAMPELMRVATAIALSELARGVREDPPGSNRGPDVDRYLIGRRGEALP